MVLATAAGMAGFLPLALEEISNTYIQGSVLTVIVALGTIGIIWVRNQAKRGNILDLVCVSDVFEVIDFD